MHIPNSGVYKISRVTDLRGETQFFSWQGLPNTKAKTVEENRRDQSLKPLSVQWFPKGRPWKEGWPWLIIHLIKEYLTVSSAALFWLCDWKYNVWYHGRVREPFIQASGRTEPFRGAFQRVDSFLKLWKYFVYFLKLLCLLTSHFWTAMISVSSCFLSGGGHFVQRLLYL